jgi:hypothetical protein
MKHTALRSLVVSLASVAAITAVADAKPKKKKKAPVPTEQVDGKEKSEQKDADRFFKSGVDLYKEGKFAEALAEFERAYEIQPHPLVLYNIAVCHRELSHYQEAVKFYKRFVTEGKGQVPQSKITTAQSELDAILARIARVSVTVSPDGATLYVDDKELGTLVEMPLILPPGEHRLIAKAPGRSDAVRVIRVASGDELTVDLPTAEAMPVDNLAARGGERGADEAAAKVAMPQKHFGVGASFGTNLVVAYAVMPSLRVRLAGDAISVHAIGAVPIVFPDGEMSSTFVAGAIGLGLRYRTTPMLAFRLESMASFAGGDHVTTIPTFLGGELWF